MKTGVKTVPQTPSKSVFNSTRFILLGEDDVDDQEMLKEIFQTIDPSFSLILVNNGKEVLSNLQNSNEESMPCLLVLDYNMPGLNGAEILKELGQNERYKNIPKIVWSTSGSEKFRNTCLELGAVDYVLKPSNIDQLEKIARHMLSFCPDDSKN